MSKLLRGNSDSDSEIYYDNSVDDPSKNAWHSTWTYIYNPQKKTCCARTLKQWMIMGCYYIVYTIFIVSLFFGFLYGCWIAIKLITEKYPLIDKKYLLDDAFPGLGVVPKIVHSKYPIIWYSADPDEQMTESFYVEQIDDFFEKYKKADRDKYSNCESGKDDSKPCYFDLSSLGDCSEKGYQYTNYSLCFFLKLNRLMDWKPVFYENEKELIHLKHKHVIKPILESAKENIIYVQCDGRNYWDKEYLGNITYYPQKGFNGKYFPYKGEENYLPPLIGLKLNNVTTGVVIHIGCQLWLKNMKEKLNHVHLKIFVDNTLPY
ncbi:hypothetical protein WA026_000672 [Henosepilachna vigintioctopunctata]|uniref:Sodium/potassium-transporting ATPase subunit beta n=1 Tax=Henosepilachna vigintioctopunctata TaxID=420089 RepID=A0AAW1UZ88_9CUCU